MYTIISYRENMADFRGGYCEGSTESEFLMETTPLKSEAILLLGHYLYLDKVAQDQDLNSDSRYTAYADVMLGIDGYFGGDHQVGDVSDEVFDQYCEEAAEIREGAEKVAKDKYDQRLISHRTARNQAVQDRLSRAAQETEARERQQLEMLKEKYGE